MAPLDDPPAFEAKLVDVPDQSLLTIIGQVAELRVDDQLIFRSDPPVSSVTLAVKRDDRITTYTLAWWAK